MHVAMSAVAWWTCALLALASARIYERCELARELQHLGIQQDHVPTWVCIAFHESRYDTAAQNPHSGDHGLLQISELYWCGAGKACGVPCSAFRDEDISDDVECALQIHEEHTRLQGDGFLAWVVYPQHCKHNTKKYLADCDVSAKNTTVKTVDKPQASTYDVNSNFTIDNNEILNEKPKYLTISSLLRGNYANELDQDSHGKYDRKNWLNFKVNNIDELIIPVFKSNTDKPTVISISTPTSTTTLTSTKKLEIKPFSGLAPKTSFSYAKNDYTTLSSVFPSRYTTSLKPFTTKSISAYKLTSTAHTESNTKNPYGSGPGAFASRFSTTVRPLPTKPGTTNTAKSKILSISKATDSYTASTVFAKRLRTPYKPFEIRPTTAYTYEPKTTRNMITAKPPGYYPTTTTQIPLPTTSYSLLPFKFTSRITNTKANYLTSTPARISSTLSSTPRSLITYRPFETSKPLSTTRRTPSSIRTTQSLFDLYLNPTTRPKLAPFSFRSLDSPYKLKIFSDGTTQPTPYAKSRNSKTIGDILKNNQLL